MKNRQELDALVERAAEESRPVLPSIQELNAVIPRDNDAFQRWTWMKQEKMNMETTGTLDTFNHSLMASTSAPFNWPASMEKIMLAMDGAEFNIMMKMSGWEGDKTHLDG